MKFVYWHSRDVLHKDVKMGLPQIRYFIIRLSLHLLIKHIKSYLNEQKYKTPGFRYQWKILNVCISITNEWISTKLAQTLSDEQNKLKKLCQKFLFASYCQILLWYEFRSVHMTRSSGTSVSSIIKGSLVASIKGVQLQFGYSLVLRLWFLRSVW